MALYPTTPPVTYPIVIESNYRTLITDFGPDSIGAMAEQRVRQLRFPKRSVVLTYKNINQTNRNYLADFFQTYYGAYGNSTGGLFYFYDQLQRAWRDEYVGRSDGATVNFDLHSKNTSTASVAIKVNGSSTWSIPTFSSTGAEGANAFTLSSAASSGSLITSDFTGYLRIKARYREDGFKEQVDFNRGTAGGLFNVVISLVECQW